MVCERCGGFKVFDHFYGNTAASAWKCDGFRCINCGAVSYLPAPVIVSRPVERVYRRKPALRLRAEEDLGEPTPSDALPN